MRLMRHRRVVAMCGGTAGAFAPDDIDGLQVWLDASQITGLANNDPVATWTDASGNANHATQGTGAKQPIYKTAYQNGLPAVLFDGAASVMSIASLSSFPSKRGTVLTVIRSSGSQSTVATAIGATKWQWMALTAIAQKWYDGVSTVSAAAADPASANVQSLRRISDTSLELHRNGVLSDTLTIANNQPSSGAMLLGGYTTAPAEPLNGYLCEVLVYDSDVSDVNLARLHSYLMNKWGITAAFTPDDITGLQVWLDASQITGMANNDPVATWTDASGNANHATQGTGAKQPLYKTAHQNGLPAVVFDGANSVMSIASLASFPSKRGTVVAVFRNSSSSGTVATSKGAIQWQWMTSTLLMNKWYDGVLTGLAAAADPSTANLQTLRRASDTAIELHRNGVLTDTITITNNQPDSSVVLLGGFTATPAEALNGYLCEVLVYDNSLSDVNLTLLQNYLLNKWGI